MPDRVGSDCRRCTLQRLTLLLPLVLLVGCRCGGVAAPVNAHVGKRAEATAYAYALAIDNKDFVRLEELGDKTSIALLRLTAQKQGKEFAAVATEHGKYVMRIVHHPLATFGDDRARAYLTWCTWSHRYADHPEAWPPTDSVCGVYIGEARVLDRITGPERASHGWRTNQEHDSTDWRVAPLYDDLSVINPLPGPFRAVTAKEYARVEDTLKHVDLTLGVKAYFDDNTSARTLLEQRIREYFDHTAAASPSASRTTPAQASEPATDLEISTALVRLVAATAQRAVRKDELEGLSRDDLALLRNTIYARHGRPFHRAALREHFAAQPWYRENPQYTDNLLTSIDLATLQAITAAEAQTDENPLSILLLLAACAPREQDCRALMPLSGDAVTIITTPAGTTGCTTNVDGISITTELLRDGLHWKPGQTWVDGTPTERSQVRQAVAAIKARRAVESGVVAAQAATTATITKAREAGKKLLDRLRR